MLIANIETIEEYDLGYKAWLPQIREPFYKDGHLWIGLSRHWIEEAQVAGVNKIKYEHEGKMNYFFVPDKKMLKKMEKDGDIIKKVHLFPDNPLKTYLFRLI
jgi:hypothetical protein